MKMERVVKHVAACGYRPYFFMLYGSLAKSIQSDPKAS
jgi:hypothetical protein